MILDTLALARQYASLSPRLAQAFAFLRGAGGDLAPGRHEINGEDVFALVVRGATKPLAGRQIEVHRNYIDVQYVHTGREIMYWVPLAALANPTMPYDPAQDAALYAFSPRAQPIRVSSGEYAIFFPEDGHIPSCEWDQPAEVYKIVVKVRV
ncbi:MAG: YhcH/YjgK/YiaL family protein [Opitutaceae bacterium]|nr:YhcH/YjgK/YiaL family protein [Opitutaceae bacterium]